MINFAFEYDGSGRLLRSIESIDGVLSEISEYETQANGRIISRSDDSDIDGMPEHIFSYEYEEGVGLVQINVFDVAGQQFIDAIRYTYENGLIVTREFFDIADVQDEASIDLNTANMTSSQAYTYEGTLAATTTTSGDGGTINSATFIYETDTCFTEGTVSTTRFFCVK